MNQIHCIYGSSNMYQLINIYKIVSVEIDDVIEWFQIEWNAKNAGKTLT